MLALANKLTNSTQPIYRFVNKYSIDFDGVDDCIITDDADTVSQPTTYSMWIKSSHTAYNYGIFGHGSFNQGSFQFNNGNKPLLELGGSYYRVWTDIPAQDDGEWHHWVVYADPNDITNSKLYCDSVLQTVTSTVSSGSANAYTESLTIGADRQSGGSHFTGKIDEFAVYDRELTQAEITRMYNTYYSPNRVANGNFSQIGNEEVTNGDFSQIGSELVTSWSNNDFSSFASSGSDITQMVSSGSGNNCYSSTTITSGKTYKLQFTSTQAINCQIRISPNTSLTSATVVLSGLSSGSNEVYFTAPSSYAYIGFYAPASFTDTQISGFTLKEVGQSWSSKDGVITSVENGKLLFNNSTGNASGGAFQNIGLVTGKQYQMTLTMQLITGASNGSIQLFTSTAGGSGQSLVYTGSALVTGGAAVTETFTFTPASGDVSIQPACDESNATYTISDISVKEVGQHWEMNSTAIFTANGINITTGGYIRQDVLTSGKSYQLTYNIISYTSGNIRVYDGTDQGNIPTVLGSNTFNFTAGGTAFYIQSNSTSVNLVIDNIVVQELKHDATNLMLNAGAYQSANPLITSTKSMEFDGSDDYLQVGDVGSVKSLSFWFNPDNDITASSSEEKLFGFNTTYYGIALGSQTGAFAGETLTVIPDNSNKTATTKEFDAGRWYNIVIAWNETASYFDIYVDGVLSTDLNTGSAHTLVDWSNFKIGTDNSLASEFNGQITETGVWDRTLTALEVASLYNQGMPTNLLVNRNDYQSGNPTVFNTKQVDFDGTDDFLNAGNVLNLGTTDFSISMWVNSSQTTNRIMGKTQDDANRWYIRSTGNKVQFHSKSGGAVTMNLTTTETFPVDTWAHLLISADRDGTVYIYINGVRSGVTAAGSATSLDNTGDLTIGKVTFFDSYFDGKISQVGMWNKALTADEVSSLYNHGLPIDLTTNQAAYESSSNLVGYWRMGSGTLDSYPLIADQTNATLGSELVTNGDFATDSDWTKGTGWTISNNKANFNTTGNSTIQQNLSITTGRTYRIQITGEITSGALKLSAASGLGNDYSIALPLDTYYTHDGGTNDIQIRTIGASVGYLDNVSIKEVGGNPAIMTNQTSSDIENGSPYANLLQNGDFSDGSTGWAGDDATLDVSSNTGKVTVTSNTEAGIKTSGVNFLTQNKKYRLTFDVVNATGGLVSGTIKEYSSSNIAGSWNGVGSYSIDFTYLSSSSQLRWLSTSSIGDILEIDNVTISEVNTGLQGYWKMGDGTNDEYPVIYDQTNPTNSAELVTNGDFNTTSDWSENGGANAWSISGGKANCVAYALLRYFEQTNALETSGAGKTYKVVFTVSNYSQGLMRINVGGYQIGAAVSSNGTHTQYIAVTNASSNKSVYLQSNANTILSVDNISVKEVNGNFATMTNMVEGNITNQYPLTKIRNYYRMGDGILDGYPIIQDQTSPNLAHIPTTNLILYSEDFSNSTWTKTNLTATESSVVSPISESNTFLIQETTYTSAVPGLQLQTGLSVSAGVFNATFYVKNNSGRYLGISFGSSSERIRTNFDFNTETFKTPIFSGTTTGTASFTKLGDFYRISINATFPSSIAAVLVMMPLATDTYPYYANQDSDNRSFYVWGAQVEEQSQATPYLKSDGIAAVRKATTTNLVPYSEDLSQWTIANGTITPNATVSPDGTQNADKVVFNNTGLDLKTTITVVAGQRYTISFYIKLESGTGLQGRFYDNSNSTNIEYYTYTSQIQGTEWSKITRSVTAPSGCTEMQIWLIAASSTLVTASFWGAQFEQQTQAETYAKTT
jgi:hypothetical protein